MATGAKLVIARLDRLARNLHFVSSLQERGVDFVAADMPDANRLTVHIIAAVAESVGRAISENTRTALAAAKARGVKLGNTAGSQQQLTQTWGMRGGFTHNWDPYWNTSVYGAFDAVRYNSTAKALICGVGGVGGSFPLTTLLFGANGVPAVCNPDYNIAQAGIITRWTPVRT
jgi:hypothetical protein